MVKPFRPLAKRAASAATSEGARLLRFAAADDTHDVQLVPPD